MSPYNVRRIAAPINDNFVKDYFPLSIYDIRMIVSIHADAVAAAIYPDLVDPQIEGNLWGLIPIIGTSRQILEEIVWRGTRLDRETVESLRFWELHKTALQILGLTIADPTTWLRVHRVIIGTANATIKGRSAVPLLAKRGNF